MGLCVGKGGCILAGASVYVYFGGDPKTFALAPTDLHQLSPADHGAIGKIYHWRKTKGAVEDARVRLEAVVKSLNFMLNLNINAGVDRLKVLAEKAAGR